MRSFLILLVSLFLAACGPSSSGGGGLETDQAPASDTDTNPPSDNPSNTQNPSDESPSSSPSSSPDNTDNSDDTASSPTSPADPVPVLSDQTLSALTFDTTVSGNIVFTDEDSAAADMVVTVESTPAHGSVVITDHGTGAFEYQPSSVSAISGDTFDVSISDGTNTSTTQTITLSFSDSSAPNISLTPNDGASNVAVSSDLAITSDDPIDLTSLTYNNSDGVCTGSVQVSLDSFTNCVAIQSITASNLNRTLTVKLVSDLDGSTDYEYKITSSVKSLFDLTVALDISHTFNTARTELLITEVGALYYSNSQAWFEVYNPSSSPVDLSDYSFKSRYFNTSGSTIHNAHTFALPSISVQPGQYVVVRGQSQSQTYGSNSRVVHIKDGTFYPFWTSTGYIDLIKNGSGQTVDFVTFGSSYTPTTGSEWSGSFATAMPYSAATDYGKGLGRDASLSDSDQSSDWTLRDWTTTGGANDITCNTDADNDGIPDCSEVAGSTFAGLPLYDWGARTGQRDIFIEVDYMNSADEGVTPRKEALQAVVDAFAAQGIAIHFDVGDLHDSAAGLDPADFDLGGGEQVPFANGVSFDPVDGRANLYDYKRDYMDYARMQVFHYLLFAYTQQLSGAAGSSGLAELNANDLIVSLGNWGLNSSNTANTNTLINYQASTLMHELGHNLGLRHGGNEDVNYKPNYISIMNYLYQLNGLPTIGTDEGDRVYYSSNFHNGSGTCYSGLSNAPNSSTFIMDFSHGNGASFNFAAINETVGLGQTGSSNVDFDCDGNDAETSVTMPDSNGDLAGAGTITDNDDWGNLNLIFQRSFSGHNHGVSSMTATDSSEESHADLVSERVGDDRAPVAQEFAPPPEFFERLRQANQ